MRTTYEYFAHSQNIEGFLGVHNSYEKIVGGAKSKLRDGKNFSTKRAKAARNFAVTEKALKDLYEPNIEIDLESVVKRLRLAGKSSEYVENDERDRIIKGYNDKKRRYTTYIVTHEEDRDAYESVYKQACKLHTELKKMVQNVEAAHKLGLFGNDFKAHDFVEEFKGYEPESRSFNPVNFLEFSKNFSDYFGDSDKVKKLQGAFDAKFAGAEIEVKDAKKNLDDAKKIQEKTTGLTDAQAAKRIVETILTKQFPDMPAEDRAKMRALPYNKLRAIRDQARRQAKSLAGAGSLKRQLERGRNKSATLILVLVTL